MTLREMQEKREKLVAEARSALNEIRSNTDDARVTELEQRHDKIMAELDKLDADMEREERMAAAERRAEETRARRRPNLGDDETHGQDDPNAPVDYRSAFQRYVSAAGDLSVLSDEERSALRGHEQRAQVTSTGSAGGYTVPTELSNQIIQSMRAWGPMYDDSICTVMNTGGGNPIDLPTIDDTSQQVVKHTEGGAVGDTGARDAVFGKKTLGAYAYDTEWVKFSWELAQDSVFNFETLLGKLLGERLGRRANSELTIGTGSNNPMGIVTASSLGKTTAAQAALNLDDVIDLLHSVDPAYRSSPKARFMFNDTVLGALRKLKDAEGRYIWTAGDVQKGTPGTILGYNYSINQAMDGLEAGKKPMIFGDFGAYYVRKVGSIVMCVAKERFAPDIGLLGLVRFDGTLGDAAAVKHLVTATA